MPETPGVETQSARDHKLASLMSELTEQLRCGRQPNIDAAIQQHPDVADELRDPWVLAQLANHFAGPGRNHVPAPECPTLPPGAGVGAIASSLPSLPRSFADYELIEE